MPWYHVIGVVGHVRMAQDGYRPVRRGTFSSTSQTATAAARRRPRLRAGTHRRWRLSFGFMTITARVDSRARAADLYQTVRSRRSAQHPEARLRGRPVYAEQFADRLLATRVDPGFGVLAFVVSADGHLRPDGVPGARRARARSGSAWRSAQTRATSGGSCSDSSLRLVAVGRVLGIGARSATARWIESQLFGVRPTDPSTLAMVIARASPPLRCSRRGTRRGRRRASIRRSC